MIAELTIFPVGEGSSLSDYVAEVMKVIHKSGLSYELHSMGTNIEGDIEAIASIVKECHNALFAMGCKRISTNIKIDDRKDKTYSMGKKVEVLKKKYIEPADVPIL